VRFQVTPENAKTQSWVSVSKTAWQRILGRRAATAKHRRP